KIFKSIRGYYENNSDNIFISLLAFLSKKHNKIP
ncbi:unnamed protein product, partial [marine sediment metagenome]